ncbi:hypothetical protein JOM56_007712 [Amanita muscaria]
MAPATYSTRTYSRKSLSKRKRTGGEDDGGETSTTDSGGRKRIRIKSQKDEQETVAETEDLEPTPSPSKSRISRTYGSALKKHHTSTTVLPSSSFNHSELFESVTPSESPVCTPKKLARRMLARSKTESSLETNPSRSSAMERTPSLPTLPSTPSRDKGKRKEAEVDNHQLPLPRQPPNIARTYAGASRSFLITIPASSLGPNPHIPPGMNVTIGDEEDDYLSRESYSSLRARWDVDNSEDDPYPVDQGGSPSKRRSVSAAGTPSGTPSRRGKKANAPSIPLPPGMMNPLKSITELRSKGESRRFLDEIGYMFEGMDKSGALSLRRTSALDIVAKLCDADFARKAEAADFLGKIWDVFIDAGAGQNEDKMLDILLVFLAALVAKDGSSLADLAQRPSGSRAESSKRCMSFVDLLFNILASCTNSGSSDLLYLVGSGDVDLKREGLSKKDKSQLISIYETIATKSRLFPKNTLITAPLLITYTLQRLPTSLLHPGYLSTILGSLRVSLAPLVSPPLHSNSYVKPPSRAPSKPISRMYTPPVISHLEWRDAISRFSFQCINAHLQLLDAFLLGQWITPESDNSSDEGKGVKEDRDYEASLDRAREVWLLESLVALAICAEMKMRIQDKDSSNAGECLDLVLRILVSQTHANAGWCQAIVRYPYSPTFMIRLVAWAGDTYHSFASNGGRNGKEVQGEDGEAARLPNEEINDHTAEMTKRDDSDEEIRWQDRLCLALGLLANLVQAVDEAKELVRETRIDPNCPLRKGACIHSCCCSRPISGLDVLTQLYGRQDGTLGPTIQARSDIADVQGHLGKPVDLGDDAQARRLLDTLSLLGHLAVLFGLLMRGSRTNEELIVGALPTKTKGDGRRTTLSRLLDQARELVSFDAAVTSADGEDDDIARGVVVFLQELRDKART